MASHSEVAEEDEYIDNTEFEDGYAVQRIKENLLETEECVEFTLEPGYARIRIVNIGHITDLFSATIKVGDLPEATNGAISDSWLLPQDDEDNDQTEDDQPLRLDLGNDHDGEERESFNPNEWLHVLPLSCQRYRSIRLTNLSATLTSVSKKSLKADETDTLQPAKVRVQLRNIGVNPANYSIFVLYRRFTIHRLPVDFGAPCLPRSAVMKSSLIPVKESNEQEQQQNTYCYTLKNLPAGIYQLTIAMVENKEPVDAVGGEVAAEDGESPQPPKQRATFEVFCPQVGFYRKLQPSIEAKQVSFRPFLVRSFARNVKLRISGFVPPRPTTEAEDDESVNFHLTYEIQLMMRMLSHDIERVDDTEEKQFHAEVNALVEKAVAAESELDLKNILSLCEKIGIWNKSQLYIRAQHASIELRKLIELRNEINDAIAVRSKKALLKAWENSKDYDDRIHDERRYAAICREVLKNQKQTQKQLKYAIEFSGIDELESAVASAKEEITRMNEKLASNRGKLLNMCSVSVDRELSEAQAIIEVYRSMQFAIEHSRISELIRLKGLNRILVDGALKIEIEETINETATMHGDPQFALERLSGMLAEAYEVSEPDLQLLDDIRSYISDTQAILAPSIVEDARQQYGILRKMYRGLRTGDQGSDLGNFIDDDEEEEEIKLDLPIPSVVAEKEQHLSMFTFEPKQFYATLQQEAFQREKDREYYMEDVVNDSQHVTEDTDGNPEHQRDQQLNEAYLKTIKGTIIEFTGSLVTPIPKVDPYQDDMETDESCAAQLLESSINILCYIAYMTPTASKLPEIVDETTTPGIGVVFRVRFLPTLLRALKRGITKEEPTMLQRFFDSTSNKPRHPITIWEELLTSNAPVSPDANGIVQ